MKYSKEEVIQYVLEEDVKDVYKRQLSMTASFLADSLFVSCNTHEVL